MRFALAIGLVGALAACAADPAPDRVTYGPSAAPTPSPDAPSDGISGAWELESGTFRGAALEPPQGHRMTLVETNGAWGGSSGCNGYGADVRTDGDSIRITVTAMELVGCAPDVMAAEAAFVEAIQAVERWERAGDRLVLTGPDVELRFVELPPVPEADLYDTLWVLESLVAGETASSPAPGREAALVIRSNGTLVGSTGCRRLTGRYIVSGDQIVLTQFAADGECPPALAAQDDHVVRVLGDGVIPDVEGDSLTLSDPDGFGLVYRAADPED